ncbi:MAG: hypothetical protein HZA82_01035, partial [Thaumarchaeota archaeon]|nr:hypothetical protein [Nitrososphaerota archaeon]
FSGDIQIKYYFDQQGKFILEALSGTPKGSKVVMTLTEREGYHGEPNGATNVKMDFTLNVGGIEGFLLGFVSDGDMRFGMDKALFDIEKFAQEKYPKSENPYQDVVQKEKSASQIKSEKKVTTKELGTVKKTDLKKEVAQKLDPKKEAEKKLKQKDTGYVGISEKPIQTVKEKTEKATKPKESSGYTGVSEKGKTDLEKQLELAKRKVEQTAKVVIPHIVLDPLPSSVNAGNIVTFSGTLYLSDIPQGAIVYIKDEDPFDSDDLLTSAYVQSNGRFSVNWISKNVDVDRVADIYAVFEGFYPNYPRLATCDSSCTDTIKLRIN